MLKTIGAIFLMLHGITHTILAVVPSPKDPNPRFAMFYPGLGSRLLNELKFGPSAIKTTAIIFSVIAMVGFITAGLALFDTIVPNIWWRVLAIASAVVSLLLLLMFWDMILIVGLVIDIGILVILFFTSWAPV